MPPTPDLIPLFPLGIVVYPEESLPLHIFEPRYKTLITDVTGGRREFGVVLLTDGSMAPVGCLVRLIERTKEYDTGEFDIIVKGVRKFQLNDPVDGMPYMQCKPTWLEEDADDLDNLMLERVITQHMRLLELGGRTVRPSLYQDVDFVSYVIARNAGLGVNQKQHVLELLSENDRIAFLVDHMGEFIPRVEQIESLRKKVQSNGHFQDFPPEL